MDYFEKVENIRGPFAGTPENVLIQVPVNENPEEKKTEVVDSDDDTPKHVVRNFTELDRLSYVVRAIEVDCQVVPVGAFRIT